MYEKTKNILIACAIKYKGDWDKIYHAAIDKEVVEPQFLKMAQNIKCNAVTILDEDYPQQLKGIFKPPFVLFYYGDISIVKDYHKNISIVGSRDCSSYGAKMTEAISSDLAKRDFVIVSGMAKGIDSIAHNSAIKVGGKTAAVLGTGIDVCYPIENLELYETLKKDYVVMSEYPAKVKTPSGTFAIRNRIVAGLSKTLVLTEAKSMSGSLITANLAMRSNTDVMCVPDRSLNGSACNRLIYAGASLVESGQDVIDQMSLF